MWAPLSSSGSWLLPPALFFRWVEDQRSDGYGSDVTCLYYEEGPLQLLQVVVYWSWEAQGDSEWLPPPHHKPFSADFFCVVVTVVHCDLEITFFDAQTCSERGYRMSLGLWAARSLARRHTHPETHKLLTVCFSTQTVPPSSETFCPVTVRVFTLSLVVLVSSG